MEYHASIPENEHTPGVRAICLESSHNGCNGRVLTLDYISKVKRIADKYNKKLYLDGARSWNAAISLGLSPKEMVNDFCLVNVCLAKGFGCPIGSLLVGSEEDMHTARFYRKQLGGAMKQMGVFTSCGLVALEDWEQKIREDNENASYLAHELAQIEGIIVNEKEVETNILRCRL